MLKVGYVMLGLAALICTIVPIIMYFSDEREEAAKLFLGFWGSVAAVTATVLAMTFIVKPVLAFIFNLF